MDDGAVPRVDGIAKRKGDERYMRIRTKRCDSAVTLMLVGPLQETAQ